MSQREGAGWKKLKVTYEFKDPEITIVWDQPGTPPVDAHFGQVYYGTKDKLVFRGGDGGCGTEDKARKVYDSWRKWTWFRFAVDKIRFAKEIYSGIILKDYDSVVVAARKNWSPG